jgi:recombination protein RecT
MARIDSAVINRNQLTPGTQLTQMLAQENIKKRFDEILGKKAPAFVSSILSLANAKKELLACTPGSIVAAAAIAATLDLSVHPTLGQAAIVPYGGVAQFQIQYKGLIQLAIRSGQYQRLNAFIVHDGELVSYNRITGDIVIDESKKKSEKVVGYGLYFRLVTGYEYTFVMTTAQVLAHATKFSKAYAAKKKDSPWFTNFDAMALKTVIKLGLSKWGILSVEMQKAVQYDQGVIRGSGEDEQVTYPDNVQTGEILDQADDVVEATSIDEPVASEPAQSPKAEPVTKDQLKQVMRLLIEKKIGLQKLRDHLTSEYGITKEDDIPASELETVCAWISNQ